MVQLYLKFPAVKGAPLTALRGFQRIHLEPGASQKVHFDLKPRDLGIVTEEGNPIVAAGDYAVSIGGGQPDTGAPAAVAISTSTASLLCQSKHAPGSANRTPTAIFQAEIFAGLCLPASQKTGPRAGASTPRQVLPMRFNSSCSRVLSQSSIRPGAFILFLLISLPSCRAQVQMKVTDKNYLDTQGFSVFLYDSTYHPVFVDQKNTAMEMILHGQRIATNGDVRLMPTPEQWDLVATLKGRHADKANNRLTADLAFPTFDLSYTLEVAAEPGGVKVSINLDKPLPEKLAGRAGFNLEFLPSIYMGKTYLVDGTQAGIFPRTPNDPMVKVLPLADEPKKAYYLEDWDKAKGYTQPLPFAEGKSITLGVDDALARVNVKSDTADLMLFDGRNRAQNGWFVLRSLIPSGKTTGAIVWHIRPDVIPNWTRPPMIAHSQVGYAPGFSKVAVLELDPKYDGPKTAKVLRLMEDGSYKQVFEGPITPSTPWLRYVYSKFDFTPVKDPGLYVIEYADQRTAPFPISKDAYAKIWQDSLDHHLAEQMDHVSVREGYRVWHGASHLDDGRMAPVVGEQFDGWNQATATDGKYKGGDHIPGMNVGGWYDAGDFDLEEPAQLSVIQSLALAYREFNLKYDELTVDEAAREVEMHRPDGVPDTVRAGQARRTAHPGAVSQYRSRDPRHARTGSAPIYAPGRRSIEDRRPHLRPEARSERSEGRLLRQAGRSLDFHLEQPVLPVERHRGAGRGGRCAERLGRRISERLPRDRDQSMERREGSSDAESGGRRLAAERLRKALRQAACWLRRRVRSLALKAVATNGQLGRCGNSAHAPAASGRLRPRRLLASDRTGPRLWN